ncbi:phage tail protein [Salmonella enterica subsp. enterica serovar Corvallis]|nr:phage tail protein [Salmonella enterica subsp. enterica serovar Molade]ECE8035835.1 phage tail protein [Salmonella enterica subsp. enterica serovar Corvallis]MBJ2733635.1 phage tail protein [Salmonella enterica subsp. enterica serovar Albany]EBU6869949.1 phage tail protein [Salmonella enterica subsp. enterica serovar Molade]ECA0394443.1 phage tail protein [Salmonella enterica subsp. enterica serovar Molade]
MTVKYYAILTNQGAARLANATMLGSKLNLTQMAVGDANGVLPTPDPAQTKLINQKRIAPLNLLSVDPNNQSQIIAEQIIPENEGGFWIREIGLYDDEGVLIAVANCPETYKPQLQEGSGRTQTIRMILVVTNTEAITLKIDPSVVLATRKYVDDEVLELRLYVDDQMSKHIAAQDPHTQYAQKHNPTFTGEPKAPTPAAGNNTTRIATTEFVQAAITALINGAPATLDTLKEIAAAINNDPKFSTTINNALAGKQPLDNTLTHLSGKDVAGLLAYLGLNETLNPSKRVSIGTLGTGPFDGSKPAINIGDSDSGFVFESDGVIGVYANSQKIAELTNTEFKIIGNASLVNGALLLGGLTHFLRHTAADDAGFGGNNVEIGSWNGIGLTCTYDCTTRIYFNTRTGEIGLRGDLKADGNVRSGNAWLDQTGNLQGSAWGTGIGLKAYLENTFNKKNTASLDTNGWHRDESTGLITQWGLIAGANGTYNFPRGFPNQCFAVLVTNTSAQGSGVDNAFGYPLSNSQFFASNKNDGGNVSPYPVAFMAFGR